MTKASRIRLLSEYSKLLASTDAGEASSEGSPGLSKKRARICLQSQDYGGSRPSSRLPSESDAAPYVPNWPKYEKLFLELDCLQPKVSKKSGAQPLKDVIDSYQRLKYSDFTPEELRGIVSKQGGSKALQAFFASYPTLRSWDFKRAELLSIASTRGGGNALQVLADRASYETLTKLGFNHKELLGIASKQGGGRALQVLADGASCQTLKNLGFNRVELLSIASKQGGWRALQALVNHGQRLIDYGLNKTQLFSIAERCSAARILVVLSEWLGQNTTVRPYNEHSDIFSRVLNLATSSSNFTGSFELLFNSAIK